MTNKKPIISLIAAAALNNVIGRDNDLVWHIPEDMKYFKKMTVSKPMIMGRKTFQSFPKPLPGRPHIVISRQQQPSGPGIEGPFYYPTIDAAIAAAQEMAAKMNTDEIMVIGGGEIYKQSLPLVDRIYLTRVEREYEGDTYFPDLTAHEWHTVSKDHRDGDPSYTFYVMDRK